MEPEQTLPPKPEPSKPVDMTIPHCTLAAHGCRVPGGCDTCGFEKSEVERRKQLPLTIGTDGLARKIVGRK